MAEIAWVLIYNSTINCLAWGFTDEFGSFPIYNVGSRFIHIRQLTFNFRFMNTTSSKNSNQPEATEYLAVSTLLLYIQRVLFDCRYRLICPWNTPRLSWWETVWSASRFSSSDCVGIRFPSPKITSRECPMASGHTTWQWMETTLRWLSGILTVSTTYKL